MLGVGLVQRPGERPDDVVADSAQPARARRCPQARHELLDKGAVAGDDQDGHALAGLQGHLSHAHDLLLHVGLHVDGPLLLAQRRRHGLVEGGPGARLQEGRDLEEGGLVGALQEGALGVAADRAGDAEDPVVLAEDARPGHHEEALLEEDVLAEAVLEIPALEGQGPGLVVRPARVEQAVLAGLLRVHEVGSLRHLRGPGPLAGHLRHHALRGGVLGAREGLHPLPVALVEGVRHGRRHVAEVLVRIHERLVGLLVDDEGVHLVQDEHPARVALEVTPVLEQGNRRMTSEAPQEPCI